MSFDITPPNNNLSNIQASSKPTDGGAGNTGYFAQGKKKKEEKKYGITFQTESELDSFQKSSKEQNEQKEPELEETGFFKSIINFFKNFFSSKENKQD